MQKPYLQLLDFYLLIPCYNNLSGLVSSLQSIEYDHDKFSILIMDDGSDEPVTLPYLASRVKPGLPIEVLRLTNNSGITKALNEGLRWLSTKNNFKYIARLDCGDICAPNRFYLQTAFLEKNPEIRLLGTWCLFADLSSGSRYQYSTPTEHESIARGMYFRNLFIHPTVMWRASEKMPATYPEEFPYAEDYGFFYNMLNNGRCAVIPENLVTCEITDKGISLLNRNKQLKSRIKVVKQFGKSNVFRFVGVIKLFIMMAIPSKMALRAKHAIFGV